MNEASTRARLSLFADLNSEPVLGEADIQVILDMSRRLDISGIRPDQDSWAETYDSNYAIAQCWMVKSTRLAPRYLFMAGGKMFSRNQFYEHCMELYHKFMARAQLGAIRLASESGNRLEDIPNNWNAPHVSNF